MSIHHLSMAGMLDMPAAKKLLFMSMCDDAGQETGHAFPGMDKLMAWSGLKSKSRVLELLGELVADGYLARVSAGRKGARAVFQVYYRIACCPMHDPFSGSAEPDPVEETGSGSAGPDPIGVIGSGIGSDKGSDSYRTPPLSSVSPKEHMGAKRKGSATRLPDDWQPQDRHKTLAEQQGLDLPFLAAQFRNNALAKDLRYVLWDRAFDTWLGNAVAWRRNNVTPIRPDSKPYETPPPPDRESLPW